MKNMKSVSRVLVLMILVSVAFGVVARRAAAWTLVDEGASTLELRGIAEAGYRAEEASATHEEIFGTQLNFARLNLLAARRGLGKLQLQTEGARGNLALLDAAVTLQALTPLSLTLGLFKTPISAEHLVAAPHLTMARRAALFGLVTRRLIGAEAALALPLGEGFTLHSQLGLFQPEGVPLEGPHSQLGTARILLEMPYHLNLHAAYGQHLGAANRIVGTDMLAFPHDQMLDLSLYTEHGPLLARVEGLVNFNNARARREVGAYAMVGWRFTIPGLTPTLTPALAYDWTRQGSDPTLQRVAGALNLHWLGDNLVGQLGYDLTFFDARRSQGLFLNLQVGI